MDIYVLLTDNSIIKMDESFEAIITYALKLANEQTWYQHPTEDYWIMPGNHSMYIHRFTRKNPDSTEFIHNLSKHSAEYIHNLNK